MNIELLLLELDITSRIFMGNQMEAVALAIWEPTHFIREPNSLLPHNAFL